MKIDIKHISVEINTHVCLYTHIHMAVIAERAWMNGPLTAKDIPTAQVQVYKYTLKKKRKQVSLEKRDQF